MSGMENQASQGREMLQDVAMRYATQHGLQPDKIEWVNQGYDWWLRVCTADHTVRVVFSQDEIEAFTEVGPENRDSKAKIRNAFASLEM